MSELKPCPMCGGNGNLISADGRARFHVQCASMDCRCRTLAYVDVDDAIAAWNRRASGWISVEDGLPDEDETVIAVTNCGFMDIAPFIGGAFLIRCPDLECVSHWMKLPEPPEGCAE